MNRDVLQRLTSKQRWALLAGMGILLVLVMASFLVMGKGSQPTEGSLFASSADETMAEPGFGDSVWSTSVWPIVATVFVLGLLYASLWTYRRFVQHAPLAGEKIELVRVKSSVRLAANQTLHVVQFGDDLLLIGATQTGLTLLDKRAGTEAGDANRPFEQLLDKALDE